MRVLLLMVLACCASGMLRAQSVQIQSLTATVAVWDSVYGTRGIKVDLAYYCGDAQRRVSVEQPVLRLRQEGRLIYKDATRILPLTTNQNATATLFIPYRQINLLPGTYTNIEVELAFSQTTQSTWVSFNQPQRYQVDLDLQRAEIKQQLENYDQIGNPKEWLPDGYYTLTTNGGTVPLYQSAVSFNQYQFPPQKIKVQLLEGESLIWSFYDRDGHQDELLGQYTLPVASDDFVEDYLGKMFGKIKNVDFNYAQRTHARQAINIYSNGRYIHNKKKGVGLAIRYDLAKAYIGKKATVKFNFYDKNGIRLSMPVLYSLGRTPEPKEALTLIKRGRLQYFIPFYIWKEDCHSIEFFFEIEDSEERVTAARHVLLETIQFDDWIIDANLAVKEQVTYKGAQGVQLDVSYQLAELYQDAPLHIYFYQLDGTQLPTDVYHLSGGGYSQSFQHEHITQNPRQADRLSYFIPYNGLKQGQIIAVRAELLPDVAMNIFEKFTPALYSKKGTQDVKVELVKASERFRADNYGQVLELAVKVPLFYQDQTELRLKVLENGKPSDNYIIDGLARQDNRYLLSVDSARVYIILPHRRLKAGAVFEVEAQAVNSHSQRPMGAPIRWNWTAPKQLFNSEIEVGLTQYKFEKKILRDTGLHRNFPWEYVIEAGGDELARQLLTQRWDGRNKSQYTKKVRINREDNIKVKLRNTQTGRELVIWHGDLSKWEQSNFKTVVENRFPVKIIKIAAKVPEDYDSNQRSTPSQL